MIKKKRKLNEKKKPVLRIIWLIIGILIMLWNVFWFVKINILNDYALVKNVILYNVGIFLLIIYILIALIASLIKKFKKMHN